MARGPRQKTRISRSARAGLSFPVARTRRTLKKKFDGAAGLGFRLNWAAATYATAVAEYLTAEVMEISGNAAKSHKCRRITPRHIMLACKNDAELEKFLSGVTIPSTGVAPNIHAALQPKQANASKSSTKTAAAAKTVTSPTKRSPQQRTVTKAVQKIAAKAGGNMNNAVPVMKKPLAAAAAAGKPNTKVPNATPVAQRQKGALTILGSRLLASGHNLQIISSDIVDVKCDALVNPCGGGWDTSGQVGGRLQTVGGPEFAENVRTASKEQGNMALNEVGIAEAGGNFEANHVIFCHAPSWDANNPASSIKNLTDCTQNCLKLADKQKITSICLPSIGSGGGGIPKQTAAQTIIRAISAYFKTAIKKSTLKTVYFDLYDDESVNVYKAELGRLVE